MRKYKFKLFKQRKGPKAIFKLSYQSSLTKRTRPTKVDTVNHLECLCTSWNTISFLLPFAMTACLQKVSSFSILANYRGYLYFSIPFYTIIPLVSLAIISVSRLSSTTFHKGE